MVKTKHPKQRNFKRIFLEIVSILFIFLFVYTASAKLWDFQRFQAQLNISPLPSEVAWFTAWFIPTSELVAAVLLCFARFRLYGLMVSSTLMAVFTAYVLFILFLSKEIPCSCGGVLESMGWQEHLIFNIIFLSLGLFGIRVSRTLNKDNPFAQRTGEAETLN